MRCRSQRDEELPTVGVGSGVRHRQDALLAVAQAGMELVGELVARSADPLTERVAALDHESVNHAMKNDAVVVRLRDLLVRAGIGPLLCALGQTDEVGDRVRRLLVEEANREVPFTRDELSVNSQCGLLRKTPNSQAPPSNPKRERRRR